MTSIDFNKIPKGLKFRNIVPKNILWENIEMHVDQYCAVEKPKTQFVWHHTASVSLC